MTDVKVEYMLLGQAEESKIYTSIPVVRLEQHQAALAAKDARITQLESHATIQLINTRDLLEELFRRYEHAIFAGLNSGGPGLDELYEMRQQKGNTRTCQGLAFGVIARCEQDYAERSEAHD